jgi:hypothetical protein
MANPRRSQTSLQEAHTPAAPAARKWVLAAAALAALLALAWFDGGEKALRPIAEDVALPGQGQ